MFKVGDRVKRESYGLGAITDIDDNGQTYPITVTYGNFIDMRLINNEPDYFFTDIYTIDGRNGLFFEEVVLEKIDV